MPVIGPASKKIGDVVRQSRRRMRKYIVSLKNRKYLQRNSELKDAYKGKRAFILACGPSINSQDLSPLAGEFCVSVSNFFVHKDFKAIKPAYHIFAESHTPITDDQMEAWFNDAEAHFSDRQKVVVAVGDRYIVEGRKLFQKSDVYYYDLNGYHTMRPSETIDFTKRIPTIQTVAHQAIYLAMYSGATEIYLLGFDHDTILHLGQDRHFYQKNDSALMQKGLNALTTDWGAQFVAYARLWELYRALKKNAERHNVKIVNVTPGSLLDVFPREKLEDVLSASAKAKA